MKTNTNLLGAAVLVCFFVVIGVSVNYHYSAEKKVTEQKEVMERAYQDVVAEEETDDESSAIDVIIKIFDKNDALIDSRVLKPEELPDEEFSSLMRQSTLIAEYNNSYVYQIKD